MAEPTRGLLDTSVVIDLTSIDPVRLPDESAVAAITLAELAAGPHATNDADEAARRQDRLQWAASTWEALPFDADAARPTAVSSPPCGRPVRAIDLASLTFWSPRPP